MEGKSAVECIDIVSTDGVTVKTSQQAYSEWAKTFDEVMFIGKNGWNGPVKVSDIVRDHVTEERRGEVRILDVGAGTGLVAKELKQRGFRHIDAFDPNEAMLKEARKLDVYEKYYVGLFPDDSDKIPDNSYDVLTGSGILAYAHVPCESLHEMARLVKPGGFIVLVTTDQFLEESDTYCHLQPLMDKMEADGKWKTAVNEVFSDYFCGDAGRIWCFQML